MNNLNEVKGMTPFERKVQEVTEEGSIVYFLCCRPTSYMEYKRALSKATEDELNAALQILQEFPKINGASRKNIQEKLERMRQKNVPWTVEIGSI